MIQPISIGRHKIACPVFLAPMSGVSDLPFRRLAWRYGAGLVISEMVACEALANNSREMATRARGEGVGIHVVQLAGREEKWMSEGARMAAAAGADILDINMGCPARKVTNGYSGSALMQDPDHALRLIEATVQATELPVCLKMRLGWDENSLNAGEIARRAQNAGIQLVTIHGRTRNQFYKGRADWAAIRRVSEQVDIPVIANGDIVDMNQVDEVLTLSGANGIMIGRGGSRAMCAAAWRPDRRLWRSQRTGKNRSWPQNITTPFCLITASMSASGRRANILAGIWMMPG